MTPSEKPVSKVTGPKGISSAVVKKMAENGRSKADIARLLNISVQTVYHHLKTGTKSPKVSVVNAPKAEVVNPVKVVTKATPSAKVFEMNIFGTTITVDRKPNTVTVTANKLIIK